MIWQISEVVLLSVAFLFFLVVIEVGFRLGRRSRDQREDDIKNHVGALQAAELLLLALRLGFTFAMAVSRFDARHAWPSAEL